MKRVWMILALLGYYASIIVAGICFGFKAIVPVILASCCASIATSQMCRDEVKEGTDEQ